MERQNKILVLSLIGLLFWWLYKKRVIGLTYQPEVIKEVEPAELPPSMKPKPEEFIPTSELKTFITNQITKENIFVLIPKIY